MLLVDTNVIVAALIRNTPWYDSARALHAKDADWVTESHALVELGSVLVRQVRTKELTLRQAGSVMAEAETRFVPALVPIAHLRSVELAVRFGVSAYDARFLAAAERLGVALVTEDTRLRRAAPALTQSIEQALG